MDGGKEHRMCLCEGKAVLGFVRAAGEGCGEVRRSPSTWVAAALPVCWWQEGHVSHSPHASTGRASCEGVKTALPAQPLAVRQPRPRQWPWIWAAPTCCRCKQLRPCHVRTHPCIEMPSRAARTHLCWCGLRVPLPRRQGGQRGPTWATKRRAARGLARP